LERFNPLFEAYKQSEEYKKLSVPASNDDEEDDNKKDTDPKGYFKYSELVSMIN